MFHCDQCNEHFGSREAAAAAGAPPPETTPVSDLPSASFTSLPSTTPLTSTSETTSTAMTSSVFALHTTNSWGCPAGYHSETSSSVSQVGLEEDVSVLGDLSPEQFHRLEDLVAAEGTRRPEQRWGPVASSVACQTHPDAPPSPELLQAIKQEIHRITLAQPGWSPSRICHTMLANLRLPPTFCAPQFWHRLIWFWKILLWISIFRCNFCCFKSSSVYSTCTTRIINRPRDNWYRLSASRMFKIQTHIYIILSPLSNWCFYCWITVALHYIMTTCVSPYRQYHAVVFSSM